MNTQISMIEFHFSYMKNLFLFYIKKLISYSIIKQNYQLFIFIIL